MTKAEIQQVKLRFGIIGNTDSLVRAIDVAIQVAPTDLSVLITGDAYRDWEKKADRKSTRLNSSHITRSRMPSSA